MASENARDKILKNIRQSLNDNKLAMPFPEVENNHSSTFISSEKNKEELYAEEFIKLGGKFIYCEHLNELVYQLSALVDSRKWKKIYVRDEFLIQLLKVEHHLPFIVTGDIMDDADAGISLCENLIARLGSTLMSSAQTYGRQLPVYSTIHITVAFSNQIVYDINDGLKRIKEKYAPELPSLIHLATGPSRTADIEKTLVVGVHGPKEVFTFLVDKIEE